MSNSGGRRGLRDRDRDDNEGDTLGLVVLGELAQARLDISRLIAERDDMLKRAEASTQHRIDLQSKLSKIEEETRKAQRTLKQLTKTLHRKEDKLAILTRHHAYLRRMLHAECIVLYQLETKLASLTTACTCPSFKVGAVIRRNIPHLVTAARIVASVCSYCIDILFWPCVTAAFKPTWD